MCKVENRKKYKHSIDLIKYSEDGLRKRCILCAEELQDGEKINGSMHNKCWADYQRTRKNSMEEFEKMIDMYKPKWDYLKEKYKDVKKCNTCLEIKNKQEFYPDKKATHGYQNKCILCVKEYNRNSKRYEKESNKQKHREYQEKHKEKWVNLKREKYNNDPNYKLLSLLRSRILNLLKSNRINKNNSSILYLGCSLDAFKCHLESQFLPEFTWKNHGEIWEIDHIIPCSSFDFSIEDNIFRCFHYTNHQPLFKTTDIAKSFGYEDQIGNRNKYNNI